MYSQNSIPPMNCQRAHPQPYPQGQSYSPEYYPGPGQYSQNMRPRMTFPEAFLPQQNYLYGYPNPLSQQQSCHPYYQPPPQPQCQPYYQPLRQQYPPHPQMPLSQPPMSLSQPSEFMSRCLALLREQIPTLRDPVREPTPEPPPPPGNDGIQELSEGIEELAGFTSKKEFSSRTRSKAKNDKNEVVLKMVNIVKRSEDPEDRKKLLSLLLNTKWVEPIQESKEQRRLTLWIVCLILKLNGRGNKDSFTTQDLEKLLECFVFFKTNSCITEVSLVKELIAIRAHLHKPEGKVKKEVKETFAEIDRIMNGWLPNSVWTRGVNSNRKTFEHFYSYAVNFKQFLKKDSDSDDDVEVIPFEKPKAAVVCFEVDEEEEVDQEHITTMDQEGSGGQIDEGYRSNQNSQEEQTSGRQNDEGQINPDSQNVDIKSSRARELDQDDVGLIETEKLSDTNGSQNGEIVNVADQNDDDFAALGSGHEESVAENPATNNQEIIQPLNIEVINQDPEIQEKSPIILRRSGRKRKNRFIF